jgi:hypothetical protein
MKFGHSLILFVAAIFCLCAAPTVFCQTEKLGIVSYAAPKGWTKTPKENVVGFSEINQKTGGFCIITLYGATGGTGNPANDFTREWKRLVFSNLKVEANPTTETQVDGGWTMTAGGSAAEMDGGGKAVAFLSVFSGDGKTVSVLGVFNEQSYLPKLEAFVGSVEMDKTVVSANNPPANNPPVALDSDGNLVIPEPTRQLTIADLVGEWGDNPGRISTTYVNRSDGSYAGTDSLHFTSTWKIDGNGKYSNDFFEVRNGKKLRDITTGTITINGRLITIKHKGTAKYVVRGWLELPDMTILKVAGPWFDDQEIPEKMFTDFSESSRFILSAKWVRKK